MDTKLTLKLDQFVIKEAKKYAATHKRSLSRIIESYLKTLINRKKNEDNSDFKKSQIPIMTPDEFLNSIKN